MKESGRQGGEITNYSNEKSLPPSGSGKYLVGTLPTTLSNSSWRKFPKYLKSRYFHCRGIHSPSDVQPRIHNSTRNQSFHLDYNKTYNTFENPLIRHITHPKYG